MFALKQKLTLIFISSMLTNTVKREITIKGHKNGRWTYVARGKYKEYYLDITREMLVFEGWEVPFDVDTHAATASYNFKTDKPGELRIYLRSANLNKTFDDWINIYYLSPKANQGYEDLFNEQQLATLAK